MSTSERLLQFSRLARVQRVYACTYPLRIIHTLRRYNDSSGSMILVHIIWWYYSLVLLLPAACCRSIAFVFTGQRLVCDRVGLWCTSGLASMKLFAIVPSDIIVAYFASICIQFFSCMASLIQSQPGLDFLKLTKREHG